LIEGNGAILGRKVVAVVVVLVKQYWGTVTMKRERERGDG
jgi:hypothetical protein